MSELVQHSIIHAQLYGSVLDGDEVSVDELRIMARLECLVEAGQLVWQDNLGAAADVIFLIFRAVGFSEGAHVGKALHPGFDAEYAMAPVRLFVPAIL